MMIKKTLTEDPYAEDLIRMVGLAGIHSLNGNVIEENDYIDPDSEQRMQRNQNVSAAAYDLYDALRELYREVKSNVSDETAKKVNLALSKAAGRSHE